RIQLLNRPHGRMIDRPGGDAADAEQALRIGADPAGVRILDLGLRLLSKGLAAQNRTLPTVYGIHLGSHSLDLWIAPADPSPPSPWQAHDGGQVWRLNPSVLDPLQPRDFADVLAPYPGLISLGTDDGGRVLADLEAAHGLICLDGPTDQRKAALAAIAVELATSAWSDHMRLTLVGFGDDLRAIAPGRIHCHPTLEQAIPEMEARTAQVKAALDAAGTDSVLTGRCRGVSGEAWMPHYLIMADQPSRADAQRLVGLARTGRRLSAGFIVAGHVEDATWHWTIDENGLLSAGVLGFEVDAQRISEPQYRAVARLFTTATRQDGVPLPTPERPESTGETPVADIRLLGPISVTASGPIDDARRDICTEVLAYLATHPGGVHPTVLSGAIWPRGITAGARDATLAMASDWLGRDARGRPNLYTDERGRIRLGSQVRVDWQEFRFLLWRSAAEAQNEQAFLSHALDLVRGPLMSPRPKGRYAWLATDTVEFETIARVSDAAHRLTVIRLDDRDPRSAVTAARTGLLLAPEDEGLWRDLLRATDATGDLPSVQSVIEDLRSRTPLDLLQPETEALIEELTPHQYSRGA
ncbi:AfsR/SARP family transcriptional regulator, partial [Actinocorallia lasiicapitis]